MPFLDHPVLPTVGCPCNPPNLGRAECPVPRCEVAGLGAHCLGVVHVWCCGARLWGEGARGSGL